MKEMNEMFNERYIYFEALISETYVQLAATDANVLRAQALCSETSY